MKLIQKYQMWRLRRLFRNRIDNFLDREIISFYASPTVKWFVWRSPDGRPFVRRHEGWNPDFSRRQLYRDIKEHYNL